ncbi:MAG TPA: pyridoxal-phosphate dependent enzyme [Bryobacteraceae bacterium]|nr:pyridoxal-phosphate dependent enzyme [Bryobacteraceae bacterium]
MTDARCWFQCMACGSMYRLQPLLTGCPQCRLAGRTAPLEVRYDLRQAASPDGRQQGMWRWRSLLPDIAGHEIVSLGEGSTPLRPFPSRSPGRLYLKNETSNPTWSWKDRSISVSVSMARAFGFRRVAAVSTGNHGVAASAYAAAGGCESLIFCHQDAPDLQRALMQYYGARVLSGGRRERMLARLVAMGGWFPASVYCPRDGCANPFGVEGFKTIAFEIFEQLGGSIPHSVFVPCGSGDGIYGIFKGFRELREIGLTDRLPRMFLCQAATVAPYLRAFRAGASRVTKVDAAPTAALSIAEPIGGDHALRAVYESGGEVVAANEQEIENAARNAAGHGYAIEPASAAALACGQRVGLEEGEIRVVVASGAAVKWPDTVILASSQPKCLPEDFEEIEEIAEAPRRRVASDGAEEI